MTKGGNVKFGLRKSRLGFRCKVNPQGWNLVALSEVQNFVNVPHPWVLSIIKHEAKFIMNQTYIDPEVEEWEGYFTYLSLGIISLPLLRSKHNILGSNHAKVAKKECLLVEGMHRTTLSFYNIYHITIIKHCYMPTIRIFHIEKIKIFNKIFDII